MLNAFSPGLGIGGQATGSLDFSQPSDGSFPARRGAAQHRRLHPYRHRHPLARRSTSSWPAACSPRAAQAGRDHPPRRRGHRPHPGAAAAARRRRRLVDDAGCWPRRSPGGIRYNGPAEVPMVLRQSRRPPADRPDRHRRRFLGPGRRAAASPAWSAPTPSPIITRLTARGSPTSPSTAASARDRLEIVRLSGRAGSGTVEGHGTIGLASAAGYPIDSSSSSRTRSWRAATTSPGPRPAISHIVNDRSGALISGTLDLGEARYQIVRQASAEMTAARRRPPPRRAAAGRRTSRMRRRACRASGGSTSASTPTTRSMSRGMGLDSEWRADLRVQGTTATPQIVGTVDLIRGELRLRRPPLPADRRPCRLHRRPAAQPDHRPRMRPATSTR